jgi:hypothetical protein
MQKVTKLKNKYTGDIFCTNDFNEIAEQNGIKFVRVFHENHPDRTFLVNRDAFEILTK